MESTSDETYSISKQSSCTNETTDSTSCTSNSLKSEESDKKHHTAMLYQDIPTSHKMLLLVSGLLAICKGILPAISYLILGKFIDSMVEGLTLESVVDVSLLLLYLGMAGFILDGGCTYGFEYASVKMTQVRKQKYVESILRQDIGYFDMIDPMTLSSKLYVSAVQIRAGTGLKVGQLISSISGVLSCYIISLIISWKITLMLIAATPIMAIAAALLFGRSAKMAMNASTYYQAAGALAEESFQAIRTVAAFGLGRSLSEQYNILLKKSYMQDCYSYRYRSAALGAVVFLAVLQTSLGWYVAGVAMERDLVNECYFWLDSSCFSPGGAIIVLLCITTAGQNFQQIPSTLVAMNMAKSSNAELNTVIKRQPDIAAYRGDDDSDSKKLKIETIGKIKFNGVSFAYPARKDIQIFENFDLTLHPGQAVALVGPSACSTIL